MIDGTPWDSKLEFEWDVDFGGYALIYHRRGGASVKEHASGDPRTLSRFIFELI
jgi:hypothetical protein